MFKKVLVPVDVGQTEAAAAALSAARELCERDGTEVTLLNVIESVPAYVSSQIPEHIHQQVVTDANAALEKMVTDNNLPSDTKILVREGHPSTTILDLSQELGTDVIVVASHDPGGLADYLLGSVAGRVVRHAHCSVLVVRNLTV